MRCTSSKYYFQMEISGFRYQRNIGNNPVALTSDILRFQFSNKKGSDHQTDMNLHFRLCKCLLETPYVHCNGELIVMLSKRILKYLMNRTDLLKNTKIVNTYKDYVISASKSNGIIFAMILKNGCLQLLSLMCIAHFVVFQQLSHHPFIYAFAKYLNTLRNAKENYISTGHNNPNWDRCRTFSHDALFFRMI